jgi:hypothetical protein
LNNGAACAGEARLRAVTDIQPDIAKRFDHEV